jgi:hypothetical protein
VKDPYEMYLIELTIWEREANSSLVFSSAVVPMGDISAIMPIDEIEPI